MDFYHTTFSRYYCKETGKKLFSLSTSTWVTEATTACNWSDDWTFDINQWECKCE